LSFQRKLESRHTLFDILDAHLHEHDIHFVIPAEAGIQGLSGCPSARLRACPPHKALAGGLKRGVYTDGRGGAQARA